MIRSAVSVLLLAATLSTISAFASADGRTTVTNVDIKLGSPPPPRIEDSSKTIPAGCIWSPGYWCWYDNRFVYGIEVL